MSKPTSQPTPIGDLLPNAPPSSPGTGGRIPPAFNMRSNADAPMSPERSRPSSTTASQPASGISTTQPHGGRDVVTPPAGLAGPPAPAREVVKAAMREIEAAQQMIDCLPPPLIWRLNGQRESEITLPIGPDQVWCPLLTTPPGAGLGQGRPHVRHTILRQGGYLTLKAYVDAQHQLAPVATTEERIAAVAEGLQFWRSRLDSQMADDMAAKALLRTRALALDGYPLWVIRAAWQRVNSSREWPPEPTHVLAVCTRLWGKQGRLLQRGIVAVSDCEELRPEWRPDDGA